MWLGLALALVVVMVWGVYEDVHDPDNRWSAEGRRARAEKLERERQKQDDFAARRRAQAKWNWKTRSYDK